METAQISFPSLLTSHHINPIFPRLVGGFSLTRKTHLSRPPKSGRFYVLDMLYVPAISQKPREGKHMFWIPRDPDNRGSTVLQSNPTLAAVRLCAKCMQGESFPHVCVPRVISKSLPRFYKSVSLCRIVYLPLFRASPIN